MPTNLTKREGQILQHIADGLSNKEISAILKISVSTTENHIHNLYSKLNITKRSQAIIYALKENRFKQDNKTDKLR